jgi:hypothetical protein
MFYFFLLFAKKITAIKSITIIIPPPTTNPVGKLFLLTSSFPWPLFLFGFFFNSSISAFNCFNFSLSAELLSELGCFLNFSSKVLI